MESQSSDLGLMKPETGLKSKEYRKFLADQSTYAYGSGKINLQVEVAPSSLEYINMGESFIQFDLVITSDTSAGITTNLPKQNASAWINTLDIKTWSGSSICDQVGQYNGIANLENTFNAFSDYEDSYGNYTEGSKYVSTLLSAGSSGTYQRSHRIITSVCSMPKGSLFPAWATRGLRLEMTMENPLNFLLFSSTTGLQGNATYSINNLKFNACIVKLKAAEHQSIVNRLNSQIGLGMDIIGHSFVPRSTTTSGGEINFGKCAHDLKRVDAFFVARSGSDTVEQWVRARNGVSTYRYKLGSIFTLQEDIAVSSTNNQYAEHYNNFLRSHKLLGEEFPTYGSSNLTLGDSDNFVISYGFDLEDAENVLSSFPAKGMDLDLKISSITLANTMYLYKTEDRRLSIYPNQQIVMDQYQLLNSNRIQ